MFTQCMLYSSSVLIFSRFFLYDVQINECTFDIYLTNLFYRYNKKKRDYKCRNTRTNSFFPFCLNGKFFPPVELETPCTVVDLDNDPDQDSDRGKNKLGLIKGMVNIL